MKITFLYLGIPWEGMKRWKATQGKICDFKKVMGSQNLDHSRAMKKSMCIRPRGKL
jgi:hypothetical protein